MFNLIKSWFKRPVVINLNAEHIPKDTKICVLVTQQETTKEQFKDIQSYLSKFVGIKSLVLGGSQSLQTLSDDDLKAIGLIRADFGGEDEQTIS